MIRENWFDWAVDVAAATNYGVREVLDCVELLTGTTEEEVIKAILPSLLGAMGDSGAKVRPSDLIKGLFVISDLAKTAGAVFQALLSGVKEGEELKRGD